MDEFLGGENISSRVALWEAFQTEFGKINVTPFQSLIDNGQTKGKFVIEETDSIIKHLESIYCTFSQIITLDNKSSNQRKSDMIDFLIWKLDLVMEGMLGIARVASSSFQNITQAIIYSRREILNLNKHKDGGYFAMLQYYERGGELGKRRSSDMSFEEAIKMFASDEIIHSHENEKQHLTSNKITLKEIENVNNAPDEFTLHKKNHAQNVNSNNLQSNHSNSTNICVMRDNSSQYEFQYMSRIFCTSKIFSHQTELYVQVF